jgi:hypothetical protein
MGALAPNSPRIALAIGTYLCPYISLETDSFRAFYALLGSPLGSIVVELLAPRKATTALGSKTVKSITLFAGDTIHGMTEDELSRARHPVMLFELVDLADLETATLLSVERVLVENQIWTLPGPNGKPKPFIHPIRQPQIGTQEGNLMTFTPTSIDTSTFE